MAEWNPEDLDQAPCGFLVFSDDSLIQSVNLTFATQLGYADKNELVGKSFEAVLGIAGRIFYQTHFFPLIKMHGKAEEIFFLFKTKDRQDVPMICNAQRRLVDGKYTNHCAFFRAVERGRYEEQLLLARRKAEQALLENTELHNARKLLEEHSIELDRKLNQLVSMNDDLAQFSTLISHDMQESIRKIALFADKVSIDSAHILAPEIIRDLNRINRECIKIRELVTRLESFISLNAKKEMFRLVNLDAIFSTALRQILNELPLDEIAVSTETMPVLEGDPEQLQFLFYHLIRNSILYRHPARALSLDLKATLIQQNSYKEIKGKYRYIDYLQINFTDNGSGFDQGTGKATFGIHRKQEDGRTALGFGLALCKKIMDNHSGFIELTSSADTGTVVIIRLPLKH